MGVGNRLDAKKRKVEGASVSRIDWFSLGPIGKFQKGV